MSDLRPGVPLTELGNLSICQYDKLCIKQACFSYYSINIKTSVDPYAWTLKARCVLQDLHNSIN